MKIMESKVKILKGGKDFEDERGKISNYKLPEPVNWIGLITSKAGSLRANHYHPKQQQKVMLILGSYIGIYKDLTVPNGELEECVIRPGDIEVISPNIAHTMIFLEDSVFLNLVKGERKHENFGIHTVPYTLVKKEEIKNYVLKHKNE